MPEWFYRASSGAYKPGFPLKARGNDDQKFRSQSVFGIESTYGNSYTEIRMRTEVFHSQDQGQIWAKDG